MLSRGLAPSTTPRHDGALTTALPWQESPDEARLAALKQHQQRKSKPLVVSDREAQIRAYQDLVSGGADGTGKYAHADLRPNGGTQIGGSSTSTPSMTADFDSPTLFKTSSTILGKGAPPIRGAMPPHLAFRVA